MALISCPECNREVSDQASSCPHCGYALSSAPHKVPRSTPIGPIQKSFWSGGAKSILSLVVGVAGFLLLFLFPVFGIALLIGSIVMLIKANAEMVGTHSIQCPYCGRYDTIESTVVSYRCPKCQQRSIKRDNYMVPTK